MSKIQLLEYISENITTRDWGKTFVNIQMWACTNDSVETLAKKIEDAESQYKILLTETPMTRYLSVLK
jgi:hypothetical protein